MRFKEFLQELDLKGAAKKSGLADIHAKQQQAKKDQFDAKYNTGMPVKIKLKVYVKKPSWTAQDPYEYKEFTIDNLIDIRHRLADVTLIDLATADDDKSKHDAQATFAIMKTNKHYTGSLPEYLHGLPARTRKKPGFGPYDLRREAWTDSPIPFKEGKVWDAIKHAAGRKISEKDLVRGAKFKVEKNGTQFTLEILEVLDEWEVKFTTGQAPSIKSKKDVLDILNMSHSVKKMTVDSK